MYKLLTEEQKKKVEREYSLHRSVVMIEALILVIIVAMVGLFPSYILSETRRQEIAERVKISGQNPLPEEEKDLQSWLTEFNQKLAALSPEQDKERISNLIFTAIEKKTSGVKITGIDWVKEGGIPSLTLTGVASDRQALISLEESFNTSGYFKKVELPISSLAKDKNIDFKVKLNYTQ